MPKTTLQSYYQNFNFHLLDVTPAKGLFSGEGLGDRNLLALSPQLGFKSADPPETEMQTEEVEPGNDPLPHHFVTGASFGTVTLSRGVLVGDNEFWRWVKKAIWGRGSYRRTLALIQAHGMPAAPARGGVGANAARLGTTVAKGAGAIADAVGGGAPGRDQQGPTPAAGVAQGGAAVAAAAASQAGGPAAQAAASLQESAGRAWVLQDCFPVNYNPAADGLEGDDSDITIAELELQPEMVHEGNFPPVNGAGGGLA